MRTLKSSDLAAILAVTGHRDRPGAVTRVPSADGQFWDIQDTSPWAQDSGGIATGGRANPFNGFGYLKLQVRRADNAARRATSTCGASASHHDGAARFDSITPLLRGGILVRARSYAPTDTDYLRYFDSFTNRRTRSAWSRSRGAAPPAPTRRAGWSRSRPRRPAIAASIRPTPS